MRGFYFPDGVSIGKDQSIGTYLSEFAPGTVWIIMSMI